MIDKIPSSQILADLDYEDLAEEEDVDDYLAQVEQENMENLEHHYKALVASQNGLAQADEKFVFAGLAAWGVKMAAGYLIKKAASRGAKKLAMGIGRKLARTALNKAKAYAAKKAQAWAERKAKTVIKRVYRKVGAKNITPAKITDYVKKSTKGMTRKAGRFLGRMLRRKVRAGKKF